MLNRPLGDIPTAPASLGALLRAANPATVGVNPEHWRACVSRMRAALQACGVEVAPGRDTGPLSPPWQGLLAGLPSRTLRIGLSRPVHYLSRNNVSPGEVTAEHLAGFATVFTTSSLHKKPGQTCARTMRQWNEARAAAPDWPQVEAVVSGDLRRYSLDWSSFPRDLQDDVERFLASSGDPDPLSDDYYPAVKPGTVAQRRRQLRILASALVASGFAIERLTSLAVLCEPANAKAALRRLLDRQGGKKSSSLADRAALLRTVARYWVKDLQGAEALAVFVKGLSVRGRVKPEKNRLRLRQLDLKANRDSLLMLPIEVAAAARATGEPTPADIRRLMLAAAVEILIMAALRADNLTGLRLDRHLLEVRRGRQRHWRIVIGPDETKTGQPIDVPLPTQSVQILEDWLKLRPRLLTEPSPFLFPGPKGGRRNTTAFSTIICKFIHRETGIILNVHLFRHWCAKLHLELRPEDIETVRRLLGHTSTSTTLRAYAEIRTDLAFRSYDATICRLRGEAERLVSPKLAPRSRKP